MTDPNQEYDLYKDSPVRLLGYTNEAGEALRGFIGAKWVRISYGIATLYVLADTIDKTGKTFTRTAGQPARVTKTLFAAGDTLIWQMLASVFIPGYAINRVCALTNYALVKNAKLPANSRNMIVTGAGLAVIPFIIKPIDDFVDFVMDATFRKITPHK